MNWIEKGVRVPSKNYFRSSDASSPRWLLSLLCTGLFYCDPGYRTHRAGYDSGLVMEVLEGKGFVVRKGRRVPLHAGDICLIDCYSPHSYGTDTGWKILWAHFTGKPAQDICASISEGTMILHSQTESLTMHNRLLSVYEQFENGQHMDDAQIHCALTEMITPFFRTSKGADEPSNMDSIAACLSEHLTDGVSNAELARMAHMSESQLIRVFQQHKGTTPHKYLLGLRLNAAQYYLASSDMPITQIALQCGFTDASALTNSFRKAFGVTPKEYRNRNANEQAAQPQNP